MLQRSHGRTLSQARPICILPHFIQMSQGSVLCEYGNTKVICTVNAEDGVPGWMRQMRGQGWLTAEYSMLPGSTGDRTRRERQGPNGRTQEIQRLIGRSLRSIIDLSQVGERTFSVDCDVIQADAGTRTASITGSYVALRLAVAKLLKANKLKVNPIKDAVAALSVALVDTEFFVDPDYNEDQRAELDLNIVMTGSGKLIEVQGSAERGSFTRDQLNKMMDLAQNALTDIFEEQNLALERSPSGDY